MKTRTEGLKSIISIDREVINLDHEGNETLGTPVEKVTKYWVSIEPKDPDEKTLYFGDANIIFDSDEVFIDLFNALKEYGEERGLIK